MLPSGSSHTSRRLASSFRDAGISWPAAAPKPIPSVAREFLRIEAERGRGSSRVARPAAGVHPPRLHPPPASHHRGRPAASTSPTPAPSTARLSSSPRRAAGSPRRPLLLSLLPPPSAKEPATGGQAAAAAAAPLLQHPSGIRVPPTGPPPRRLQARLAKQLWT